MSTATEGKEETLAGCSYCSDRYLRYPNHRTLLPIIQAKSMVCIAFSGGGLWRFLLLQHRFSMVTN
jgi:hypothetical protein